MEAMTLKQIQSRITEIQKNNYQGAYDDELDDLLREIRKRRI